MAASESTANSRAGEGVVICVSKAIDKSDKSLLYVSKLEDNRIGEGNPVQLINPRAGMNLWNNIDLRRKQLSFGEIIKFRIVENKYVYDGKAGRKKMNIDQIQMGLDFGFNSYRGLSDACPGVEFPSTWFSRHFHLSCPPGEPEKDQIFIVAIAAGFIRDGNIRLKTINGELVVTKLNCTENLTTSVAPLQLFIKERKEEDVGDVAIIKFIQSSHGLYTAVCEGLVLRYKPKVISVEEEMVEIMNADSNYVNRPGVVTFDTGNCVRTAISRELVKELNLEDTIDHENKVRYRGVARDDDDKQISNLCSTIKINIKIRKKKYPVQALYGVPAEGTDLLIGMDIIKQLFDEGFTLGK